MEFPFSLVPLFHHPSLHTGDSIIPDGGDFISTWTPERVDGLRDRSLRDDVFGRVVNEMGKASAAAQQLKQVITTSIKFHSSKDRIYLHVTLPNTVNGILRVGEKKLFIRDEVGSIKEITPSCVLDFYVHESRQRTGIGHRLFQRMLECERQPARKFGYDRPSPKLLAFLAKHYELANYVPQNNNFVVFRKYFSNANDQPLSSSSSSSHLNRPSIHQQSSSSSSYPSRSSANDSYSSSTQMSQTYARRTQANNSQHGYDAAVSSHAHHSRVPSSSSSSYPSNPSLRDGRTASSLAYDSDTFGPQSSPPPGQASFRHYQGDDESDARALQFDDGPALSAARGPQQYLSSQLSSSRVTSEQRTSSYQSSSTYPNDDHPRRSTPDTSNRLARAGSNMLSTGNLHPSSSPSRSSTHTMQMSPSTGSLPSNQVYGRYAHNPAHRPTQYHQHNIITGYQPQNDGGNGSSHFANSSKPAANFLPDGIASAQPSASVTPNEFPLDRKARRAGIQPRPLLDPAPNGLRTVDRSIGALEESIREKEATLAQAAQQRYQIPYRTPNERDSSWSKAASYQRMSDPSQSHLSQAPPALSQAGPTRSEQADQYSNPTFSTKVGGLAGPYAQPYVPPQGPARSPFAYGNVRR